MNNKYEIKKNTASDPSKSKPSKDIDMDREKDFKDHKPVDQIKQKKSKDSADQLV